MDGSNSTIAGTAVHAMAVPRYVDDMHPWERTEPEPEPEPGPQSDRSCCGRSGRMVRTAVPYRSSLLRPSRSTFWPLLCGFRREELVGLGELDVTRSSRRASYRRHGGTLAVQLQVGDT